MCDWWLDFDVDPDHDVDTGMLKGINLLWDIAIQDSIYLFIYDKWPESATDMPMTVNSKLTHYKIRQISTENKT